VWDVTHTRGAQGAHQHTRLYISKSTKNMAPKCMGFVSKGPWVMEYQGVMSYELQFPANQLGG